MYKNNGFEYQYVMDVSDLSEKLKGIINQEIKYADLCNILSIQPKTGNSKIRQITDLALFCDYEELQNPTRYRIEEVYDSSLVKKIDGRNQFQMPIEGLILDLFEHNNYDKLYIRKSELLQALRLVNENYTFIKSKSKRLKLEIATGEDYHIIADGSEKAGRILFRWVDRCLRLMETRGYINYRTGFVLSKRIRVDNTEIISKYNVPLGEDEESKIMDCYRQVLEDLHIATNEITKTKEPYQQWIPPDLLEIFYLKLNQCIIDTFDGKYDCVYKVIAINTAKKSCAKKLAKYREQQLFYSKALNQESCRVVQSTKQLNYLTGVDRDRLIDEIIKITPNKKYIDIIKEDGI